MSKHTPGPWFFEADDKYFEFVRAVTKEKTVTIARVNGWMREYQKEEKANAHLIAAAPELLEALKSIREYIQDCLDTGNDRAMIGNLMSARDEVDRAIAKAEGKA